MKFLFLRGFWDENNRENLEDDTDMWIQLFKAIAGNDQCVILYLNKDGSIAKIVCDDRPFSLASADVIFARGAHLQYHKYLTDAPNAFTIRYGAGRRYIPSTAYADYNVCLVDTEQQREELLSIYPYMRVELFTKPAARCFKPMDVEKEFDCCYIANWEQPFKGQSWVYATAPKNLKILHLGRGEPLILKSNITHKSLKRKEMPEWINKCKVGILPYFGDKIDSEPRAISELHACNKTVVADQNLKTGKWVMRYSKTDFWGGVKKHARDSTCYVEQCSVDFTAEQIREMI